MDISKAFSNYIDHGEFVVPIAVWKENGAWLARVKDDAFKKNETLESASLSAVALMALDKWLDSNGPLMEHVVRALEFEDESSTDDGEPGAEPAGGAPVNGRRKRAVRNAREGAGSSVA